MFTELHVKNVSITAVRRVPLPVVVLHAVAVVVTHAHDRDGTVLGARATTFSNLCQDVRVILQRDVQLRETAGAVVIKHRQVDRVESSCERTREMNSKITVKILSSDLIGWTSLTILPRSIKVIMEEIQNAECWYFIKFYSRGV